MLKTNFISALQVVYFRSIDENSQWGDEHEDFLHQWMHFQDRRDKSGNSCMLYLPEGMLREIKKHYRVEILLPEEW